MQLQADMARRSNAIRAIGLSIIFCFQLIGTCEYVSAQETNNPIEKDSLIKALRSHDIRLEKLLKILKSNGVAFPLTPEAETEIRKECQYLGKSGTDRVIELARNNYRPNGRLRVSLFKYAPCEQYYDQFAGLLSSKVLALPGLLIPKDVRSSYIAGLKLVKEEKPFGMSLAEASRYWNETHSLQLLGGICSLKGNEVYMISQVFMGDLHGPLGSPIKIEFKFDANEFGTTRDIHSLLILYSLAKDAHARGLSKDLIIEYLAEALGIASQIKPQEPSTLHSIKGAIEDMLRELGASGLMVLPKQ